VAETRICPCSLPPLEAAGAVTNDPARAPYWPPARYGRQDAGSQRPGGQADLDQGLRRRSRAVAGEGRPRAARWKRAALRAFPARNGDNRFLPGGRLRERGALSIFAADDGHDWLSHHRDSEPHQPGDPLPQPGGHVFQAGCAAVCRRSAPTAGSIREPVSPWRPAETPTVQGPLYGKATLRGSALRPTPDVVWNYIDIRAP
jgi:hypothetical protein